jgi:CheY-like chemotaxis protein
LATAEILLVEDDETTANIYKLGLELGGYAVQHAWNGETAVALARERVFDLILLDLVLPDIDGFEVMRRLSVDGETTSSPVVIMLTNFSEPHLMEQGFSLGAVSVLNKADTTPVKLARELPNYLLATKRAR